jgi:hypothetical protein
MHHRVIFIGHTTPEMQFKFTGHLTKSTDTQPLSTLHIHLPTRRKLKTWLT